MNNIQYTVITGIIATAIYEIAKSIVILIIDRVKENNKEFSISGTWCAYHERKSGFDNKLYSAYELVKLKYIRGKVNMSLFQCTTDGRKYHYKGCGCLRGNKLTLAYEEVGNPHSNHTGVIILKFQNIMEHSIVLMGNYVEFNGNDERSSIYSYSLKPHKISTLNRIKIFVLKSPSVYEYMLKEKFVNDAKSML